ncbi:HDOD domain-containing protein [Desulfolutivibrio sulfoxidireducens]|uniref:HDOD domain-containing protein n=1 Tax=Desulfolutivibrio sulfoxidireducens TaxID=2773299 RepID=UPI00159DCE9A|nr:HDOD domain-containing protein [Desulfolutivibrio sulfoxidireducens]QLA17094.1 HDOD domain-containing protein [Desulfolutivibrio sulfoxidireducens]QLA20661.1 HDOD domain-containing protein [Desulfolutivibrio sulfoxidireducens]
MVKVRVSDLVPGMVLGEDVLTPGGRFLMPRGARLDRSHLTTLAGWGLDTVEVVPAGDAPNPGGGGGDAAPAAAPAAPKPADFLGPAVEAVRPRFVFVDLADAAAAAVFKICVARTARRMARAAVEDPSGSGGEASAPSRPAPPPPAKSEANAQPIPTPEELLREDPQLVSLPEVFARINDVLRDPHSSVEDAAKIIGTDPSLSAKLLKLVNSAFFGRASRAVEKRFPAKVDSLTRAVMIVGGKQLATLALGVSVLPLFRDIPPEYVNMKAFWKHSIGCGIIARALAEHTGAAGQESYFVAGLLHDIGRLILYKHLPGPAGAVLRACREELTTLTRAEKAAFSFDHALLGGLLLRKWQYPAVLEKMVRYHHDLSEPLFIEEPAVIHVADFLANALAIGTSGEWRVPALLPEAFEALNLAPADLAGIVAGVDARIEEVFTSFFPGDEDA